jgi:hypothetical protein
MWLTACNMSVSSLADSGRIQGDPIPVDDLEEVGIADVAAADQVHFPTQQLFETLQKLEKTVGEPNGVLVEFAQEIYVTLGSIEVAAGHGAKQFQLANAEATTQIRDGGAMLFDQINHVLRSIV